MYLSHAKLAGITGCMLLTIAGTGQARQETASDTERARAVVASRTEIVHHAYATVHAVNPAKRRATLIHEAVASLNWPAMTKEFVVPDPALFERLAIGKRVKIHFLKRGGEYIVVAVD